MYLVDTNVISEARKGKKANRGVLEFWSTVDPEAVYLSVITIGELRHGIEKLFIRGDEQQAKALERWLHVIVSEYGNRIISFDEDCAQIWGKMMALQNQNPLDKQIAATALIHGFKVVTHNTKDFNSTGVQIINPFL